MLTWILFLCQSKSSHWKGSSWLRGDFRVAKIILRKHLTWLNNFMSPSSRNFTIWEEFTDVIMISQTSSLRETTAIIGKEIKVWKRTKKYIHFFYKDLMRCVIKTICSDHNTVSRIGLMEVLIP